jgi:DNA-binding NtrC family response regulator
MKASIFVVDDQVSFCHHIMAILQSEGYEVTIANDPYIALELLASKPVDILLTDMKMPAMEGLDMFRVARQLDPRLSCIIMTAYGSVSSAVAAVKLGVTDYLLKPFEPEALLMAIEKTLKERQMLQEIRNLRLEVVKKYSYGNIIGKNYRMQAIYDLIEKVAATEARVFITGETGVGKELVAKAIHFNSHRKNKPFVGINCGALSESLLTAELFGYEKGAFTGALRQKIGKFEYAEGGTLFLDEIGDISPAMQVKLLRVLQEKCFERVGGNRQIEMDVRIISATNQDISEKIKNDDFRVELFYRLNVVPIHIPPLRERIDDIPLLVKHCLSIFKNKDSTETYQLTPGAMRKLMQYPWPGNVRELENVLEHALVITEGNTIDTILFSSETSSESVSEAPIKVNIDIPFKIASAMVIQKFEKAYILEALERCHGNVTQTAQQTGITSRTLWRKIKAYNLDRNSFSADQKE